MRPKKIVYDTAFEKKFEKYKRQLTEAERKRLKTHKLKGNFSNDYAFSISYSDRIVFKILDDETIYFIEVGSHDVCY